LVHLCQTTGCHIPEDNLHSHNHVNFKDLSCHEKDRKLHAPPPSPHQPKRSKLANARFDVAGEDKGVTQCTLVESFNVVSEELAAAILKAKRRHFPQGDNPEVTKRKHTVSAVAFSLCHCFWKV
jgi:hypothetical protein